MGSRRQVVDGEADGVPGGVPELIRRGPVVVGPQRLRSGRLISGPSCRSAPASRRPAPASAAASERTVARGHWRSFTARHGTDTAVRARTGFGGPARAPTHDGVVDD